MHPVDVPPLQRISNQGSEFPHVNVSHLFHCRSPTRLVHAKREIRTCQDCQKKYFNSLYLVEIRGCQIFEVSCNTFHMDMYYMANLIGGSNAFLYINDLNECGNNTPASNATALSPLVIVRTRVIIHSFYALGNMLHNLCRRLRDSCVTDCLSFELRLFRLCNASALWDSVGRIHALNQCKSH
jgi:hypothetical protein